MTKLLSLFDQVFGKHTKSKDLELFISTHNPSNNKDVEDLTRGYLYHLITLRGES